jgi:hypothetical protein
VRQNQALRLSGLLSHNAASPNERSYPEQRQTHSPRY